MRDLRAILGFVRSAWRRWLKPSRERHSVSSIDPEEFSSLLRSSRKQDLEMLAKRLSEHSQRGRLKGTAARSGKGAASRKRPGVAK